MSVLQLGDVFVNKKRGLLTPFFYFIDSLASSISFGEELA